MGSGYWVVLSKRRHRFEAESLKVEGCGRLKQTLPMSDNGAREMA